jgi:hypothetical protein
MVLAFSALDAAARSTPGWGQPEPAWRSAYQGLAAEQYPNIAAASDELITRLSGSSFPLALELFLSALAGAAARAGG